MARSYVLVTATLGRVGELVDELSALPYVSLADLTTGPYDIVLTLEGPDMEKLGYTILGIQQVRGVRTTLTLVAVAGGPA